MIGGSRLVYMFSLVTTHICATVIISKSDAEGQLSIYYVSQSEYVLDFADL